MMVKGEGCGVSVTGAEPVMEGGDQLVAYGRE